MDDATRQTTVQLLNSRREPLAVMTLDRYYHQHPDARGRYDPLWRAGLLEYLRNYLTNLTEAIGSGQPQLFEDYVAWARTTLEARGLRTEETRAGLEAIRLVLAESLHGDGAKTVEECFQAAMRAFEAPGGTVTQQSYLLPGAPQGKLARDFLQTLLAGDSQQASGLVKSACKSADDLKEVYLNVFQPVQREIGRLWHLGQITEAREHFSSAAIQRIMSQMLDQFQTTGSKGKTVVSVCVGSELHDMGLRIVADFFELDGWRSIFLGANTPTDSVVRLVGEEKADVLCISATMTYHIPFVREMIEETRKQAGSERLRILVGGYPFNLAPELWKSVGADGFGRDAREAVDIANRLVSQ